MLSGLAAVARAQVPPAGPAFVVSDGHTRIADPKLTGGGARVAFHLEPSTATMAAKVEAHDAAGSLKTVWTGTLQGGSAPTVVTWDGKDGAGSFVDTGDYELRLGAQDGTGPVVVLPVTVVRLGITEIEFHDSPGADDEFQMVYFLKGAQSGQFYVTPETHEYFNTRDPGEVSDLDLDTGDPRPAVAVHPATDEPVMDGASYEEERFNYPLAYVKGSQPRVEATLGNGGTTAGGAAMLSNYPVSGYDLRLVADFGSGATAASGAIVPGAAVVLDGPALPADVDRHALPIAWTFEYSPSGTGSWRAVLGSAATEHRVYTLHGAPYFKAGVTGDQYKGPWVEVADYVATWKATLGTNTTTSSGVVETVVKGFFGKNGGLATAIEGVTYFGSPNYYMGGTSGWSLALSRLLDGASNGPEVNCQDVAAATSSFLAMLGVPNVQRLTLGSMDLNAIWPIGNAGYTTTPAVFSFHVVVTRSVGADIIDACMQLDEDGMPATTPGVPGWNVDRPWLGPAGYDRLSSVNAVAQNIFSDLPKLH